MIETILETLTVLTIFGIMFTGLIGSIIPIFPGGVIIWLAGVIYGLAFGFGTTGGIIIGIMTVLMIASALADNVLMGAKAREKGASWRGLIAGLIGGITFGIAFPPFGVLAAPIVLFLTEYIRLNDSKKAMEITRGLMIGCGWAFIVRFGLGLLMMGLWGVWVVSNF